LSAPSSTADRALGAIFLGALAFALVVFVVYGLAMVSWPWQVDYGEGVVLQLTATLSDGQALYRDPAAYPWQVDPYAPLYMGVCAALRPLMGLTLAAGRLVSWLAALGTLLCLSLVAFRHGGRRGALLAAVLFICSPLTVGWAPMYRVDFLGLFFDVAALTVVDAALAKSDATRGWLWAGPLFALAFFTKQTFVLGAGAACATLLLRAGRRPAALFAAWTAAWIAVPFITIDVATRGRLFTSLFTDNVMPWSWGRAWPWFSQYLYAAILPLLAVIVARRGPLLWTVYLGLTSLTLVGVGRVGAYFNHFLPFHAALALTAGLALAALLEGREGAARWAVVVLAAVQIVGFGIFGELKPTLFPLAALARQVVSAADGTLGARISAARRELGEGIATLDRYPGDVVAENMALPVMAGRLPVLCDPSTLFAMALSGRWSEAAFVDAVRAHRFGVILLQVSGPGNLRFSAAALEAIAENYVEATRVGGDHLLVPKPEAKTPP
jgi:hypothetical protein